MTSKTVGVITTSFPINKDSSSGIFVYKLLDSLPATIHCIIITPDSNDSDPEWINNRNLNFCLARYAPRHLQILAHKPGGINAALKKHNWLYLLILPFMASIFIACIFKSRRIDLFHANWAINGLIIGIVSFFTRKKLVTTLRGSDVNLAKKSIIHRTILKSAIQLSDKVITVSQSLKESIESLCPKLDKEITVIENGVDKMYLDIARSYYGRKVLRIITIGSLTQNKNVGSIIRALAVVKEKFDFTMNVIGNGPEMGSLTRLIFDSDLKDRVFLLGDIRHDLIHKYLAESDVFIIASQNEGRPNVVLEAMASSLPIVASDIPGNRSLLTDNETALLFNTSLDSSLAKKIESILSDGELRERLGISSRKYIIDNKCYWDESARLYASIYDEMIKRH